MSIAISHRLLKPAIAFALALGLAWFGHLGYRAWQFETLFAPDKIVDNFRNSHRMFDTNLIRKSAPVFELEETPRALPKEFSFDGETIAINDWIETSGTTGLLVIAANKVVFEQYYQGNTAHSQAILSLPQPSAFTMLARGFQDKCPCCRRKFEQAEA